MRTFNDNFEAKKNAGQLKLRLAMRVDFNSNFTDPVWFTSHADTSVPGGADVIHDVLASGIVKSHSLEKIASIGGGNVIIADRNNLVHNKFRAKLQAGKGLRAKRVTMYLGFSGDSFSSYEKMGTYQFANLTESLNGYKLQLKDIYRKLKDKTLFTPVVTNLSNHILADIVASDLSFAAADKSINSVNTKLDVYNGRVGQKIYVQGTTSNNGHFTIASVAANKITFTETIVNESAGNEFILQQGTIDVYDTSKYDLFAHDGNYEDLPNKEVVYFQIEKEIISAEVISPGKFDKCRKGVLGTKSVEHIINATADNGNKIEVKSVAYMQGPIAKLRLAVLQREIPNQPGKVLPISWTVDIDPDQLDEASFTSIGSDLWDTATDKGRIGRFIFTSSVSAKELFEIYFSDMDNCWMSINSSGEYVLERRVSVTDTAAYVDILDDSNIKEGRELSYDAEDVRNHIEVNWHKSLLDGQFRRKNTYLLSQSITTHQQTDPLVVDLHGAYGGADSRQTLANVVSALAQKYANPPRRITLNLLPMMMHLNVGDIVKLRTSKVRDFSGTTTTIDRQFEIIETSLNIETLEVTVTLEGTSGNVGPAIIDDYSNALPDSFYGAIAAGTGIWSGRNLVSSLPGYSAGTLSTASTMTGGSTFMSGVWYHDGDLNISAGVISNNVLLIVKGHLTISGTFTGKGRGLAGRSGVASVDSYALLKGESGGFGHTTQGSGIDYIAQSDNIWSSSSLRRKFWVSSRGGWPFFTPGTYSQVPHFNIEWNGTELTGMPTDLRGTSGGQGYGVARRVINDTSETLYGSAGGAGGAALATLSRGMSFAGSGKIDLSGNDGAAPSYLEKNAWAPRIYAGAGAGGYNGAWLCQIDGTSNSTPEINDATFIAETGNYGAQVNVGFRPPKISQFGGYTDVGAYENLTFAGTYEPAAKSINTSSSFRLQFINQNIAKEVTEVEVPSAIIGVSCNSGTNYLERSSSTGQVNSYIGVSWPQSTDQNVVGYRVLWIRGLAHRTPNVHEVPRRSETSVWIGPVVDGESYLIGVVGVNAHGETGSMLRWTIHTVLGKSVPPTNITGASVTGNSRGITVKVTAAQMPSDPDLKALAIYTSATNGRAAATEYARYDVFPSSPFEVTLPIATGQARFFWFKTVDTSKNLSTLFFPNTTTSTYTTAATAANALTDLVYNDLTPIENLRPAEPGADVTKDQPEVYNNDAGFRETWERADSIIQWQNYSGAGEISRLQLSDAVTGGYVLRVGNNAGDDQAWLVSRTSIPFEPTKLYKTTLRIRRTAGTGIAAAGFFGVAADGVTLVNTTGANSVASQHYHVGDSLGPGASWSVYTGYTQGKGTPNGTSTVGTLINPGEMHANVVYLRPAILVNYSSVAGITEIDSFVVEIGADNTKQAIDAGIESDTGYLRNVNWTTTAKFSIDQNSGNPMYGIGSTTWHPVVSTPQLMHWWNAGNPRMFMGDYVGNKYLEYDHGTGQFNAAGLTFDAGEIYCDIIKDKTYHYNGVFVTTNKYIANNALNVGPNVSTYSGGVLWSILSVTYWDITNQRVVDGDLIAVTNWVLGTGWTHVSKSLQKTSGNTNTISNNSLNVAIKGLSVYYIVRVRWGCAIGNTLTLNLWGNTTVFTNTVGSNYVQTFMGTMTAGTGAGTALIITPSTNFAGKVFHTLISTSLPSLRMTSVPSYGPAGDYHYIHRTLTAPATSMTGIVDIANILTDKPVFATGTFFFSVAFNSQEADAWNPVDEGGGLSS